MDAITISWHEDEFPTSDGAKFILAKQALPYLEELWVKNNLPERETSYLLVYRPGQIGANKIKMTHIADQSEAREEETGAVGVAIRLSSGKEGVEDLVVWEST